MHSGWGERVEGGSMSTMTIDDVTLQAAHLTLHPITGSPTTSPHRYHNYKGPFTYHMTLDVEENLGR